MSISIALDHSGRLVLPKAVREQLSLSAGTRLRIDVVAGHVELTPLGNDSKEAIKSKSGIKVLKATGAKVDASAAVAAERAASNGRGLRK